MTKLSRFLGEHPLTEYLDSLNAEKLFHDDDEGFCFSPHVWIHLSVNAVLLSGAIRHRDEARRRMVVCRLDGRDEEAAHWQASMRHFENSFNLETADGADA